MPTLLITALILFGALLAGCGSGTESSTTPTQSPSPAPPSLGTEEPGKGVTGPPNLYWGAWIENQFTGEQAPWDMGAVADFEQITRKSLSLINFSSPFADCARSECSFYDFPTEQMESVRSYGAIPFFSWASNSTPTTVNEANFRLSNLTNGTYDSYIHEWATAAKAWGHPFFLRFNWEMNGDWFPWAESANGNRPGEYIAAWRHVHDIFTEVGATNATWTWCPNVDPEARFTDLSSLYPGDEYVDWTCLDGYNWGPSAKPPRKWRSFSALFASSYEQITQRIAPSKPMVVAETASSELGGSKPEWIRQMFEALSDEFPDIRGLIWFDKAEDGMDWPLQSSEASEKAFAAGIGNQRYLGNTFGLLASGSVTAP